MFWRGNGYMPELALVRDDNEDPGESVVGEK
jgi:hypothetical protein